jgi:acyl-CoA reductase-like NAD-dependent aldehyde dehydrogenase
MEARTVPVPELGSIMGWVGGHTFFIGHPTDRYDALTREERAEHLQRLTERMRQSVKDIAAETEMQRNNVDDDKELLCAAAVELFTQAVHLANWLGMEPLEVTYRIPDAIDSARKLLD